MIQLNKYNDKPIVHKCEPERDGEIMTDQELHEFGVALLTVYLYKQKGELIRSNRNIGNEYPHLIAKNPKGELLYIWVRTEMVYKKKKVINRINEKGYRNNPLTEEQKANNKEKSRTRARVEHLFGFVENSMNGSFIRTIGIGRAKAKIGMMNLTYNICRCVQLKIVVAMG